MPVGHKAEGHVSAIDLKAGTLSLNHGPVASLKWPAMTMEFKAANASAAAGPEAGASGGFEFVERQPGEYVVTSIAAAARTPAAEAAPATPVRGSGKSSHSGH